jgi:hypothetical protein
VAATKIEDSVMAQLRAALSLEDTREQLHISEADRQVFEQGAPSELVRAVVEEIGYDGVGPWLHVGSNAVAFPHKVRRRFFMCPFNP